MQILLATGEATVEVKKSRFIATVHLVSSVEEVKQLVTQKRKEHPRSRHVVHAAVIGNEGEIYSASDDNEPKNTAGRPVLEVLKGANLTNTCIIVVRYFGGTLLGTGGLVRAYQDAAKAVLDGLPTERLVEKSSVTVKLDYDVYESVKLFLKSEALALEEEFGSQVTLTITSETSQCEDLLEQLKEATHGRVTVLSTEGPSVSP